MRKFCGKAQFPRSFGKFARNSAETEPFQQNLHTRKSGEITVFYAVLVPYYPRKECRAFIKDN